VLDLKFVRENPARVAENSKNKNTNIDIKDIISLDERRRIIINEVENLKATRNNATKEIAELKKQKLDAEKQIADMKLVSDKIKELDDELRVVEESIQEELYKIPNLADEDVPLGKDANDNVEVRSKGEKLPAHHSLNHIEICTKLGIVDFERGAKVSGAGFHYYTGKGAKLERALINYFLDTHTEKNGYKEIMSPFAVNRNSMIGTGQLPKMAEDMYHCQEDDLFLIPTAEVPLTNYYNGEVLRNEDLNIRFCGYSPCFRREAGGYGKDVRGLLRVHQFNKVEMVKFVRPEDSAEELESLTQDAERIIDELGLTYRIIVLCTGDMSFNSAKTYDLEVWSIAEQKWLEVSSCSNFRDFQARRANIRYKKDANSKPEFVHTLNGSGLATPRIMVAIIEQYFDGTKITIPEVLRKYTGFDTI